MFTLRGTEINNIRASLYSKLVYLLSGTREAGRRQSFRLFFFSCIPTLKIVTEKSEFAKSKFLVDTLR
jgi:hypothetical protein